MSTKHLFCFAAKGLQSYIMRGGKLRDMVGATSLIDKLADKQELENRLMGTFGLSTPADFTVLQAAAGGARIEFANKDTAEKVASHWLLWCHAWAPDLEVVQHLEPWNGRSYGKVSEEAGRKLERNRNFPAPHMPEAGPFAKRAPRTGEPAVPSPEDLLGDDDLIDLASRRKRAERDKLRNGEKLPAVADAFGFKNADQLPNDFSQISGPQKAYLAIIHADGNGLGQMFLDVGQALKDLPPDEDETAKSLFQYLSEVVVASGTKAAVKSAMASVGKQIESTVAENKDRAAKRPWEFAGRNEARSPEAWPFTPVVLAGDDVTVVCRADLGLPFTTAFLKAFRGEMKKRLGWLRKNEFPTGEERPAACERYKGLWAKIANRKEVVTAIREDLSAGAGIVFCTNHYPFSLAYELCENLAKQAKNTAKKAAKEKQTPDSAVSFVRITGASAPTEFGELTEGILKGSDGTLLTGGPYFVDGSAKPQFSDLWEVYRAARPHPDPQDRRSTRKLGLPGSSLRSLLNFQRTGINQVHNAVARMKEVAGGDLDDEGDPRRKAWDEFEDAWKTLAGTSHLGHLAFDRTIRKHLRKDSNGNETEHDSSPLYDLLTLLVIRDKKEDDRQDRQDQRAPGASQS